MGWIARPWGGFALRDSEIHNSCIIPVEIVVLFSSLRVVHGGFFMTLGAHKRDFSFLFFSPCGAFY